MCLPCIRIKPFKNITLRLIHKPNCTVYKYKNLAIVDVNLNVEKYVHIPKGHR
jgi:hypothetical protein